MDNFFERLYNSLVAIDNYYDEEELSDKFDSAFKIGKEVADKLIECEKSNDKNGIDRCNRIINACYKVFDSHPWGESYKKNIDIYINRKRLEKKSTIDYTRELESQVLEKLNELAEYMKRLFPLGMPEFRNSKEDEHINALKKEIKQLKEQYEEEYLYLSPEDKKNLTKNNFQVATYEQSGLKTIKYGDDEEELSDKFDSAFKIGKEAADKLIECEKSNDKNGIDRCNRIINACYKVFDSHPWGESYKDKLLIYKESIDQQVSESISYEEPDLENRHR